MTPQRFGKRELAGLSPSLAIALAARMARRALLAVLRWTGEDVEDAFGDPTYIERALNFADQTAALGHCPQLDYLRDVDPYIVVEEAENSGKSAGYAHIESCAFAAAMAARIAIDYGYSQKPNQFADVASLHEAYQLAEQSFAALHRHFGSYIRQTYEDNVTLDQQAFQYSSHRDLRLLRQAEENQKSALGPLVSEIFFPTRSDFFLDPKRMEEVSDALRELKSDSDVVGKMTPREFEKYVACLFASFGFRVALTAEANDGGYDLVAIDTIRKPVTKYLVECKRYANKKVGVELVRQLGGVIHDDRQPENAKGIIVSTSLLTKGAKKHVGANQRYLSAVDRDSLLEWLTVYDRMQLTDRLIVGNSYTVGG